VKGIIELKITVSSVRVYGQNALNAGLPGWYVPGREILFPDQGLSLESVHGKRY
jgi:hypothetical protein